MTNYINLFIILLIIPFKQCSTENITQWRRQKEPPVPFRKDYTYIESQESYYKYHPYVLNWYDAHRECITSGASLFYATNKAEADAVISYWNQTIKFVHPDKWHNINWVHIGISDIAIHGDYVTIDGKPISEVYFEWYPDQPSKGPEHCLLMNKEGLFNDRICEWLGLFICKKDTAYRRTTTTEKTITAKCNIHSDNSGVTLKTFVFWPNATVPYYINPDHFDDEQATVILKSLEMFKLETCIKFTPLMVAPTEGQHVMTFINPEGLMRCKIETKGHSNYNPHLILLGYNCLNTRELYMIIMRALGLPFEHNRASRDLYIDVLIENIEPSYIQLFTKDCILPRELQRIPYDHYSVMHFGERDYSKNGHRTIKFKDRSYSQARNGLKPAQIKIIGLTPSDIKKIAVIYGPECRTRDRAAKIAICRTYPREDRRKRAIIEPPANMRCE